MFLSSNPAAAFNKIKSARSSSKVQVPFIWVGEKKYEGPKVVDGLFESLSKLKSLDMEHLEASPHHAGLLDDYNNIQFLCSHKSNLSPISLHDSTAILKRMKPGVSEWMGFAPPQNVRKLIWPNLQDIFSSVAQLMLQQDYAILKCVWGWKTPFPTLQC